MCHLLFDNCAFRLDGWIALRSGRAVYVFARVSTDMSARNGYALMNEVNVAYVPSIHVFLP